MGRVEPMSWTIFLLLLLLNWEKKYKYIKKIQRLVSM